ncbi:hypothetical protein ABZX51_008536 [Aspergillus tubingensis]
MNNTNIMQSLQHSLTPDKILNPRCTPLNLFKYEPNDTPLLMHMAQKARCKIRDPL